MPTIKDVARAAGVSIGTVSATINETGAVSDRLTRRVWAAVEQVGYSPHGIARSLRHGRSRVIGLIVSDISNPFFTSLAKAVEAVASAAGYMVIVMNSNEDAAKELNLLRLLREQRVAGILLSPSGHDAAYRDRLASHAQLPIVLVDRYLAATSFDAVTTDNVAAARTVTEYLLRLGHRRIAIVNGRPHLSTTEDRLRGYHEALRAAGLKPESALEYAADSESDTAYEAVQRALTLRPHPTAIFAANNLMLLGAFEAVLDMGFRCPEQISLAGIDDFAWSSAMRPRLTTVAQPIAELGTQAVGQLFRRIAPVGEAVPAPQRITLPGRLVIRDSCRLVTP